MGFILMLFLAAGSGAQTEQAVFPTLEACEVERAAVYERIKDHNHEAEGEKILYFASVCIPVQKAPQGKEV